MDDTYTLRLFEDCVQSYNWSDQLETTQQSSEQNTTASNQQNNEVENASTANINCNIGNGDNQSNDKLKASALCSLLVEQVQNLFIYVAPQLDSLNLPLESSDYRLRDNDFTSLEAAFKALNIQLRLLSELSDLATESLKTNHTIKNRKTQASLEITEATTATRNASLNTHEQHILSNDPFNTEQSLPLDSQATTLTNNERPPATTNSFKEAINLPKMELFNQPKRFWHNRELETLEKGCPAVQIEGAPQRTPLELKLPVAMNQFKEDFYLGVHPVTSDKNIHDQKLIVPINTAVQENHKSMLNKLECLIFNNRTKDSDEFDPITKGVFSKINQKEVKNLRKKLTLKMINLYQDVQIDKDLIKRKKLIWCRLMFAIYIKLSNGQFERVSPPVYSDLIEEVHGAQSIDTNTVLPNEFCERGGQMIFIPLNETVIKQHLRVRCNDKDLNQNEFQIAKKILSFETPASTQGRTHLHVIIQTRNINDWISLNDFTRPYRTHDKHPDPCGLVNED